VHEVLIRAPLRFAEAPTNGRIHVLITNIAPVQGGADLCWDDCPRPGRDELRPNLLKHRKVDKEVSTLAQRSGHRFIERCHLDTHAMVRAVIKHRHKIAISADQYDAIYGLAIYQAHDIHA